METGDPFIQFTDTLSREEFSRIFKERETLAEWFTSAELDKFDPVKNAGSLAVRYLVKKRICEELGLTGMAAGMEILNDSLGKPVLSMGKAVREAMEKAGFTGIHFSLSHSRNYFAALTVFSKE